MEQSAQKAGKVSEKRIHSHVDAFFFCIPTIISPSAISGNTGQIRKRRRKMDILLSQDGDLFLTDKGDISLAESVAQKIKIRIMWWLGEWRWDEEEGIPYKDELLVKDPDTDAFEMAVREKIFEVEEVTEVKDVSVSYDASMRSASIRFEAITDEEAIRGEVTADGRMRSD